MSSPYHQFCPVSKAMELLDERWTMLVVRELVLGSRRFNDLRRGLPRMSPTLLSRRLVELSRAGLVVREADGSYTLTQAGAELRPVVEALGTWGTRWIGELGDEDLDPKLLLWDMHRSVDHETIPSPRAVVKFAFRDVAPQERHWWLVLTPQDADVCDQDPGFPVAVGVDTDLRTMVRVWRGDTTWTAALRSGAITLDGPHRVQRELQRWLTLSPFAAVPRPEIAAP